MRPTKEAILMTDLGHYELYSISLNEVAKTARVVLRNATGANGGTKGRRIGVTVDAESAIELIVERAMDRLAEELEELKELEF